MSYQAIFYRDDKGIQPVKAYRDSLDAACRDSIDWTINLLNGLSDATPLLGDPYSSGLKGNKYRGFRELRTDCGKTHYRIIFRRHRRFFILLHMVYKTDDIEEGDKKTALARWNDFIERMSAVPRLPPRAMGSDAP